MTKNFYNKKKTNIIGQEFWFFFFTYSKIMHMILGIKKTNLRNKGFDVFFFRLSFSIICLVKDNSISYHLIYNF